MNSADRRLLSSGPSKDPARGRWDGRALSMVAVVVSVVGGVLQAIGLDGMLWVLATAAIGAPLATAAAGRVSGRKVRRADRPRT